MKILKRGSVLFALLLLWGLYVIFYPAHAANALARFTKPLADVPPASMLSLQVTPRQAVTVIKGEDLAVSLQIASKDQQPIPSPVIAWQDGSSYLEPSQRSGKNAEMKPLPDSKDKFNFNFTKINRPFAFRVFAGGTYSRSIKVDVEYLPRLKKSIFRVIPPAYTEQEIRIRPGPPAPLSYLPGTKLQVALNLDHQVHSLIWRNRDKNTPFIKRKNQIWSIPDLTPLAGEYAVVTFQASKHRNIVLARGKLNQLADQVPDIDFISETRNRDHQRRLWD